MRSWGQRLSFGLVRFSLFNYQQRNFKFHLNGWDIASSLESGHLGRFISNKETSHIQTKLSSTTAVVLWPGLHHSPVISFPLPCRVAAQRMRTERRATLAIVSPVRDKPFISLRFQGGRARSSLHAGFWIRGKGALVFFTFCKWAITTGNRNKEAPVGILLVLSPLRSLPGGNLPLLPAQLGSPPPCLALRKRHFKIAGLAHVYPSENLFPLAPWTPGSQEPDLRTSNVRYMHLEFHFCPHISCYYFLDL